MIFIKLIRILAVVFAVGLTGYLLYSVGKESAAARQRRQNRKGHRKFVKSSVIEEKEDVSEEEDS